MAAFFKYMHEMALAKGILDIVHSYTKGKDVTKVTEITVLVGDMTGVVWDSLVFSFKNIAKNTIAEDALLVEKRLPLIIRCRNCNHQKEVTDYKFICEKCASSQIEIISGRELRVESMEVL